MIEIRRARPLLGTRVEIVARGGDRAGVRERLTAAVRAAFGEVAEIHRLHGFHDPASELSRLNSGAARAPQRVDRRTVRLLRRAKSLHRATGGAFDPTVAPRLVELGLLPRPAGAPEPDPGATFDDVELDGDRVAFRRPLWLDLGGIAKGLAVDRAVEILRRSGAPGGIVDAGGDLRVFGASVSRVAIRDAETGARVVALVELRDGALASSSAAATRTAEGVSHLVDPARRAGSGAAVGIAGATVVARSCVVAEAWTKGVLFAPAIARQELARWNARALVVGGTTAHWLDANETGDSEAGRAA